MQQQKASPDVLERYLSDGTEERLDGFCDVGTDSPEGWIPERGMVLILQLVIGGLLKLGLTISRLLQPDI